MEYKEDRMVYLQMIESVIDRMSTKSGNVKGFCATVFAGIIALTFKETSFSNLLLSSLSVFIFLNLDLYYLGMERRYRFLYNKVRCGGNVDFELKTDLKESEIKESKSGFWDCLKSKTTIRFYLPIIIILIIILILKFKGVM